VASVIGQRVRRLEDPRFLTGKGRYVDDLRLQGALHVAFVRSPWAHAHVRGIDASAATALDGVRVFTAQDLDIGPMPVPPMLQAHESMRRPLLAGEVVRFAGEAVAVALAPTRELAVDAAELVAVDYEPLPAVTDAAQALRGEVLLFEQAGSNVCLRMPPEQPQPELFSGCEVTAAGTFTSQRIHALPIEPRANAAVFEDGRLTIWLSTQTPHQDRDGIAGQLGLEPDAVRVIAPDVGGGFGGKGLDVEDVLVAWLARTTARPVRWSESRSENLVAMHHGRAQRIEFEIGGDRAGRVRSLRLRILQDAGAYPSLGAFLPVLTRLMASGVYAFERVEVDITAVVTNTTPTGPVRGAGRPEATQVLERAIDTFAREAGLDPAEVRRRSFIPREAFPYTTPTGAVYDSGDFHGALERLLKAARYEELRAEQARRRREGTRRQLGIGLSSYVEITNGLGEREFGAVEITAEGEAIVRSGSFSHGQGHETTFAQIVADRLGLPLEKVRVRKGDTGEVPRGTGTYGSKSTQIGGAAAAQASEELVEKGKRLAASELEANPEDMVLDRESGSFHVAGAPQPALTWTDLAVRLESQGRLSELSVQSDFQASQPTFPFGAHLALVEVDIDTGAVELQRLIAVDDAGTLINPLIAEGQVHGGLAAGIAQALFEELTYDEDGNPQNSTLVSYLVPAATELPPFERIEMETPTPINALGAKGIGESGTIGVTPAVHNAVLDALAPFGVRELEMPAVGERVWRALQEARGGAG
jgi:carbon-monoxide dehydrogenase large subunit